MRKTSKLSYKSPVHVVNRIRDGKVINKLQEIFLGEILQILFYNSQFKKINLFY